MSTQTKCHLSNQRGAAIMIALTAMMLITAVVVEISTESIQERIFSSNKLERVKTYYAARSAVEFSMFRIYVYKVAQEKYGSTLPEPGILEMVWQMPFAWPPALGEDASLIAKNEIKDITDSSWQDVPWTASIQSEGAKIDLNDLNSPSETLQEATKKQLIQILTNRLAAEDDWAVNNRDLSPEEIVNNIMDWIDSDTQGRNGATEEAVYKDRQLPEESMIPPNREIRTLDELRIVEGVDEEIFNLISKQTTVYGMKGINVNEASKEVLRSINPDFTDELVNDIIERRTDPVYGSFSKKSFEDFLSGLGFDPSSYNPYKIPLVFDKELNFRITGIGASEDFTQQITVVTYDFTNAKTRLSDFLTEEEKQKNQQNANNNQQNTNQNNNQQSSGNSQNQQQNNNSPQNQQQKPPSIDYGRPKIVFWQEH